MSILSFCTHPAFHPTARPLLCAAPVALSLQPTLYGWALRDPAERLVFSAEGPGARQRCLERARELGIIRLTFSGQLSAA